MRCARDIGAAIALLTVVPSRSSEPPTARAVAWFPWVGAGLGALAWGLLATAHAASISWGDGAFLARAALPVSAAIVSLWAALTRFLHWDGLADVADAWWGGHNHERRLEIMADSATGAFGATAIVLVGAVQVASVAILAPVPWAWPLLVATPVLGRLALVFAAWLGVPARPGGLGARIMGRPSAGSLAVAVLPVAGALAGLFVAGGAFQLAWGIAGIVVAAAVPHLIAQRMGGVTGDVMGASVLVSESALLLIAALVVAW